MATIAKFGKGRHKVRIDLGIGTVWLSAADRTGIARILRKWHCAYLLTRHGKTGDYLPLSYRDMTARPSVLTYFTTTKDGLPLIRQRINFYKRAGELVSMSNYGYRKGRQ